MNYNKIIFVVSVIAIMKAFSISSFAMEDEEKEMKRPPTVSPGSFKNISEGSSAFSQEITQREKALLFHKLHTQPGDEPLILPNAWDALSAKIYENNGAQAIATTSAGIAAVFGYPDGQLLPKQLLLTMVERIVNSVNLPVSVDLEAGYGTTPEEICETVSAILKIGAVGINIEDANPVQPGELFPVMEQIQKIKAIRELAQKENFPLFINARTDTFWFQLFSEEERLNQTIVRLKAYQEAGADGVFIPGLTDPQLISEIAKSINLPLNVLGGEWVKDTRELKLLGVSRFTIGSSAIRDIVGHLKQRTICMIKEKIFFTPSISYNEFCNLFPSKEDKDNQK